MADDVTVKVGAESSGAVDGVKDVAKAVRDLHDKVSEISDGVSSFKDRLLEAFTVDKIIEFVGAMVDAASATERMQVALGTSADMVATFQVTSMLAGTTVAAMSESMSRLERTVSMANAGIDRSVDLLAALGLKAKDFQGLNVEQKFDLIASKIAPLKDSTEKTAIATQLLGGAATALLPTLNEGAGGLQRFHDIMQRSGLEGPPEFIEAMGRIEIASVELQSSLVGIGKTVATAFAPAIQGVVMTSYNLVEAINDSIKSGGAFYYVVQSLVVGAQALASAFSAASAVVQVLWEGVKTAVYAIGESFMRLGKIIYDAFTLNIGDIKEQWALLTQGLAARMQIMGANTREITKKSEEELTAIFAGGAAAKERIAQTSDANLRRRNQDAISAAVARIDGEIKLEREGLKQKISILNMEEATGRITQNQKFSAVMQYTEQAYQAELRLLQQELQIGGLKVAQRQQINNRILQLQAQHNTEMLNLDRQSIQAEMQYWSQFTNTIASSFNSGLRGILTGQMTFAQAFKNILLDLSLKTVEMLVTQPVSKFIAGQLAMLTASQTTAAGQEAATIAATEAALPAKIATFTSDITARAAAVFAGIFANLAPILGPAAAGPAAAGQATVLAQLAAVPKFDVGSWSVPRTGLAVIHKDEMILPAGAPAEAARAGLLGGGAGGGQAPTFVIQAMDGASVQRWLVGGGAKQIADQLAKYYNANRSSRP
jgi:hypothetical protein